MGVSYRIKAKNPIGDAELFKNVPCYYPHYTKLSEYSEITCYFSNNRYQWYGDDGKGNLYGRTVISLNRYANNLRRMGFKFIGPTVADKDSGFEGYWQWTIRITNNSPIVNLILLNAFRYPEEHPYFMPVFNKLCKVWNPKVPIWTRFIMAHVVSSTMGGHSIMSGHILNVFENDPIKYTASILNTMNVPCVNVSDTLVVGYTNYCDAYTKFTKKYSVLHKKKFLNLVEMSRDYINMTNTPPKKPKGK